MSLIVEVYPVPWKILALVKARILKNRAKKAKMGVDWSEDVKQMMSLQPGPLSRRRRDEPSFIIADSTGWLLIPSGPYNETIEGFECVTDGLPPNPLKGALDYLTIEETLEYVEDGPSLRGKILPPFQAGTTVREELRTDVTYDSLDSEPAEGLISGSLLESCTFEGIIDFPGIEPSFTVTSVPNPGQSDTTFNPPLNDYQTVNGYVAFYCYINEEGGGSGDVLYSDVVVSMINNPSNNNLYSRMTVDDIYQELAPTTAVKLHFAIQIESGEISGYINGERKSTRPTQEIKPDKNYSIFINIRNYGFNYTQVIWTSAGNDGQRIETKAIDCFRFSFSGIRFTAGSALYSGESFTPPTSITELA
jgi:hypothetical protein